MMEPLQRPRAAPHRSGKSLALAIFLCFLAGHSTAQRPQYNFEYDAEGNGTKLTDPLLHSTQQTYDRFNRPTQTTDANGGLIKYQYDGLGRLKQVTDPRNLATTYTYNGLGDLISLVSPDTGSTTYTYDEAGNLKTVTDARGVTATYTYDAGNRLTQVVYSGSGFPSIAHAYHYDQSPPGAGKLTQATTPGGGTIWDYDSQGRIARKSQTIGGATYPVDYGYTNGRPTSVRYPSGHLVSYQYQDGRVSAIALDGLPLLAGVGYFPFGPASGWNWSNGQAYVRSFDSEGRLASHPLGSATRALSYDLASRITGTSHAGLISADQSYTYDSLDRLTGYTGQNAGATYSYDATGNRLTVGIGGFTYPYSVAAGSNRLTSAADSIAPKAYTYDAAGHIVSDGNRTFAYDATGRMVRAAWGTTAVDYTYDAFGQRIGKSSAGTLHFVFDEAGRLLGEYDAAGAARTEYVYLDRAPVAIMKLEGGATALYYIHTDHLEAPRAVIDPQGNLRWRWISDPFGTMPPEENPMGIGGFAFNLRLPGQYFDQETGLHYNYFRDYDPSTGRYIQSDPIGLAGGINLYAYVRSNPLSRVDPLGLYDLGFAAGFHIPVSPGVAVGPVASSSIPNYSQNPNGQLVANPIGTDVALGIIADAGVNVGISDISETGGKCAGNTVNFGAGRYAGLQITFRQSQDQSLSIFNPARYIDAVSIGLGIGIATPVSASRGF